MIVEEFVLKSLHDNRSFGCDVRFVQDGYQKPIVLFVHGFKGFKDAMHFNMIADYFANSGFVYIKMNMSKNGVTPDHPVDFVDLEAFANNNFTTELDDMKVVLDFVESDEFPVPKEEKSANIYLIGHSRGGGISILKTCEDTRIKKLVTWAAVPDFETWWPEEFVQQWRKEGVQHVFNSRTKQNMPLNYQMVEDFEANRQRLSIPDQLKVLDKPFLAIHGSNDETVPVGSLKLLKSFNSNIETYIIEGAAHTFGGKHPWEEKELPIHSQELVDQSIKFLLNE